MAAGSTTLISQTLLKTKQTKKREKQTIQETLLARERKNLGAKRGEGKPPGPFLSLRSKDGRDRSEEECVPEGEGIQKGEQREKGGRG